MDGVLGSETESHVIMDGTVNIFHGERDGVLVGSAAKPEKLIIDTDPGIDDTMAILMAFQSPELEVLGLTTIFGNVFTEDATRNALLLCEIAGRPDVPVAEGSPEPLKGGIPRVADFIHGSDGLGNTFLSPPKAKKIDKSASEFLVDKVSEYPGEVSILALGPLTNLALAIKRDSSFASKVKRIVVLGGAFFALGNVNPAAEANIDGDPEAADLVFTSGANIAVVGINITTQVKFTDGDLLELRQSKGKYAKILSDMCKFYRDWHVKSDGVYGIFLHDPVSFVALVRPDLFTYKNGVVRVETQGICAGHTLMDQGLKRYAQTSVLSFSYCILILLTMVVKFVIDGTRATPGQGILLLQLLGLLMWMKSSITSDNC
ncbi:uridine nucleosidase 1 isoform X1 [Populus alba x Populus x berolinensis]|uniref:Inosine nucleosidase n=1 Tax=Populus alba x Populus x berolinensis TaxID=444605 RepID=A0AAD6VYY8_9ROSI|nr:uridine nucleosidase 1 isoform X1 [Populus alba x Populus x berolinensis]